METTIYKSFGFRNFEILLEAMKNYVSFEFSTLSMPLESKCACATVTAVLKQLLSRKESKKEIRNVRSNKSRKNENLRLFEHKAYSSTCFLLIYHSNLSFTKNIADFKTPWITGLCGCLRCNTTWFWKLESIAPSHCNVRTPADFWPLCLFG